MLTGQLSHLGPLAYAGELPPTLTVRLEVTLPDGRSFTYEESSEYEKDEDGDPKYFDLEDATTMVEQAERIMRTRFE